MCEKKIACVTGASGRIGKRLVAKLKKEKFHVRVLQNRTKINDSDITVYEGDIGNKSVLDDFLCDAQHLFHFAAELNDQDKMWDVNVISTKKLVEAVNRNNVEFFCFLSSAGVVGKTFKKEINEETDCAPQNLYERSKLEAERIVVSDVKSSKVIVLRPTNVVDEKNHGVMQSLASNTLSSKLKLFLRGGELAHVVHADDVVNAALYFIGKEFNGPQCFFVGYDEDNLNTFSGLRLLYDSFESKIKTTSTPKYRHLPIIIPHILRKVLRGHSNMGDLKYSSKMILSHGFSYKIGLRETVRRYWLEQQTLK